MNLYLIRHAESEANVKSDIVGGRNSSVPLSNLGKRQAIELGSELTNANIQFDSLVSSSAIRAIETASYIKHRQKTPHDIITYSDLEELSQGIAEGKHRSEIYTPEVIKQIRSDPYNFKQPGGESQRDVTIRVMNRLWDLIKNLHSTYNNTHQDLGIVCHGYVIKSIVSSALNINPGRTFFIDIDNASVTKFIIDDNNIRDTWRLSYLNRVKL